MRIPVTNVVWTGTPAAQRGVLPAHREHGENSQQVVVPRSARRAVPVEHDPTHEHEPEQEHGLDAEHARRGGGSRAASKRLDQRDAGGDADREDDDRHEPLRGEAPVTAADEDAEADGVAAHVRHEQAGQRQESDGVDVPAHHSQRERSVVR